MKLRTSNYLWLAILFLVLLSLVSGTLARAIVELRQIQKNRTIPRIETVVVYQPAQFSSFLDSSNIGVDKDESTFLDFRNQFIQDRVNFVEVDLRKMVLRLYEQGRVIEEILVLSKGRDGSWWETPTGKYSVLNKEVNHFSSIGRVWMPWSIQFYGNFFIHGWPYYPDGTPVHKDYSGGCVRLSVEGAKDVFNFVQKEMPILVLDEPSVIIPPESLLVEKAATDITIPDISAKAAFIADLDSGLVLLDKNAGESLPVASLTKLMTAVVASELIYLERSTRILPSMLTGKLSERILTSRYLSPFFAGISLVIGRTYTAFDLLYPLLMQSSNEAASVLASFLGEKEFIQQMNNKVQSLGMTDTSFADASGKDDNNISTGRDLAKLAKYILEKRNFLFDISKGKKYFIFGPTNFGGLKNYNEFFDRESLIGVKNGQTNVAKQTMMSIWSLSTDGDNALERRIAIVILGSNNRRADTEMLLGWLRNSFGLK